MERLKVIDSSDTWFGFRRLKTILTHEYPDNEAEILKGIALALSAFDETVAIINTLKSTSRTSQIPET